MKRFCLPLLMLMLLLLAASAQGEILISEVGASNHCTYFDENGGTPDWVELYNNGSESVQLDGWKLSDSKTAKKALPLDGMTVPAGGYLLVPIPEEAFGLSASGESVYLFR